MGEKRRDKRKICRSQVKFGKESCDRTAFTSNLSQTGFFVRTNRPYAPGTVLLFEFRPPEGDPITVKGRVMHAKRFPAQFASIRKSGMGIEILERDEAYLKFLQHIGIIEE